MLLWPADDGRYASVWLLSGDVVTLTLSMRCLEAGSAVHPHFLRGCHCSASSGQIGSLTLTDDLAYFLTQQHLADQAPRAAMEKAMKKFILCCFVDLHRASKLLQG